MTKKEMQVILEKAKTLFRDNFAAAHVRNTANANTLSKYNVNPFLVRYLANFLTGNDSPESIAKALVYPRVLGTSATTSFGNHMQYFCSEVLDGFASMISGIDIEFVDQIDGRTKYCQLKAGPNTINADDVDTILGKFDKARGVARSNRLPIQVGDLIVGVSYGTSAELSQHYRTINKFYPVTVGEEFWHRLTGDVTFYTKLIKSIGEVAIEVDGSDLIRDVIEQLAEDIVASGLY